MLRKRKLKKISDGNLAQKINSLDTSLALSASPFSQLPAELIIHILQFVPYQDVKKNVDKVCRLFHGLSHEHILKSLYGKSLQFEKWQKKEIDKLAAAVDQYIRKENVTFFNRPHQNTHQKMRRYILAACIIILLLGTIYSGGNDYYQLKLMAEINNEYRKSNIERINNNILYHQHSLKQMADSEWKTLIEKK